MKLSKAEIAAVVITVIFIAVTVFSVLETDGQKAAVTVSVAETAAAETALPELPSTVAPEASVNINTASAEELSTLPGIGEALATRIIAYREEHGAFENTEEIMSVSGIGAKTYAQLKDRITVN